MLGAATEAEMTAAPEARFCRGAHRFVGGQLERHAELVGRKAARFESMFEPGSCARARFGRHPVDVQQIAHTQALGFAPRMLGPNDDHQLVARHRLADESRIVDLAFDEAEIRFAAANRGRRLARIANR